MFKVSKEKRFEMSSLVVLNHMFETGKAYPIVLQGEDRNLQEYLDWLVGRKYLELTDGVYIISPEGQDVCTKLMRQNEDFIRRYDVLRAVDTHNAEFAFSSIFEYSKEPSVVSNTSPWDDFLDDDRWHDLRLAAAEFHNIEMVQILFVAFLADGEFDTSSNLWQFDLRVGDPYNRMERIINNRISLEELGESFIKRVMVAANEVMIEINEREAEEEIEEEFYEEDEDYEDYEDDDDEYEYYEYEVVEDVVEYEEYYEYYDDPYYVNPYWSYRIIF